MKHVARKTDPTTGRVVAACPHCQGESFVHKRTVKGKLGAGLLAPKRLRCLVCSKYVKA